MWAVGSTESIYSYVNNHTSSYSPALDLYFQHTLPHQQSIQVNVTGTLIHTKNNRKYKEYKDENAPLADIQTLVDGDKRSVIGEAIYEKNFKEVKLSGGARHYQMRTENEYKGSNPTTSKMDQSQTSAFFEVQGKVKDFSYAGSVGMTRAWFKESEEDHAYYTFTPTVRLSYNLKKAGFLLPVQHQSCHTVTRFADGCGAGDGHDTDSPRKSVAENVSTVHELLVLQLFEEAVQCQSERTPPVL